MIFRIVIVFIMLFSIVSFGGIAWMTRHPSAPVHLAISPRPMTEALLVVSRTVRAGGLLKAEDIAAANFSPGTAPGNAWHDTPSARAALIGALALRNLTKGEALLPVDLLLPGAHGFLATLLAAGMHAVAVPMDAASGSVGMVWPGDRVDVVLTQIINDSTMPNGRNVLGTTVLTNLRVIAIDKHLVDQDFSAPNGGPAHTAILEVTEAQAQSLLVAEQLGPVSLTLRATSTAAGQGATGADTWAKDVSAAFSAKAAVTQRPNTMRVFQGANDAQEFHF